MHLYTIAICTDGSIMNMGLCLLLAAICTVCHWLGAILLLVCVYMTIVFLQIYLCHFFCPYDITTIIISYFIFKCAM